MIELQIGAATAEEGAHLPIGAGWEDASQLSLEPSFVSLEGFLELLELPRVDRL